MEEEVVNIQNKERLPTFMEFIGSLELDFEKFHLLRDLYFKEIKKRDKAIRILNSCPKVFKSEEIDLKHKIMTSVGVVRTGRKNPEKIIRLLDDQIEFSSIYEKIRKEREFIEFIIRKNRKKYQLKPSDVVKMRKGMLRSIGILEEEEQEPIYIPEKI